MSESFVQKLKNEAIAFVVAPIYPFLQKDWWKKMWIFGALSYLPVINVIIARGWRMDYIQRLGWHREEVLPRPRDILTFLKNGILLWIATGVFLILPTIIFTIIGIDGIFDLLNDILTFLNLMFDYFSYNKMSFEEFSRSLFSFIIEELLITAFIFIVENIWLFIYIPIYRIGMLRFALTGKLIQSHLSIVKNLTFIYRNFIDIVLMYSFNVFNFLIVLIVSTLLSLTVIGVPLIPILIFFMPFWNSGYEYGLLARVMVEQEGLTEKEPLTTRRLSSQTPSLPNVVTTSPMVSLSAARPANPLPQPSPTDAPTIPTATTLVIDQAELASAATVNEPIDKFCIQCGQRNKPINRFCTACGQQFE